MLITKEEDYDINNKGRGLLSKQQRRRTTMLTTKVEDY